METTTTRETAAEVCKILDALTAISVDISCHNDAPGERMVLSAEKVRETCRAITEAVASLKRILRISEANGGGLIPASTLARLQRTPGGP